MSEARRARFARRFLVDGYWFAPGPVEHGSTSAYDNHGCRCALCRAANAAKSSRARVRARKGVR